MKNSISNKVFEQIEKHNIEPKPQYVFLLKKSVLFFSAAIAMILGSLTFSIIIHILLHRDWQALNQIQDTTILSIIQTLPYFWIITLIIFGIVLRYQIKYSENNYRFPIFQIIITYLLMIITMGSALYAFGLGGIIEEKITRRIPIVERFPGGADRLWNAPQKGILGGRVLDIHNSSISLQDTQKNIWEIQITDETILPNRPIQTNIRIKVFGRKISQEQFEAKEIIPWFKEQRNHPNFLRKK